MSSIRPMNLVLSRLVRESADTVTLFLEGPDRFVYKAGQFCTVDPHQFKQLESMVAYFEHAKGKKEPPRAYSMSSAPGDRELAITIKEEIFDADKTPYPPVLSGLLVHGLTVGMPIHIVGFTGPYVLPDDVETRTSHIVHISAGSGIVPNFSILKDALARGLPQRHTLLYANKTTQDIIFRDAIDALRGRHPDKLRVIHSLSREPEAEKLGPDYRQGRVTTALLQEVLGQDAQALVYLCGPGITPHEARAARRENRTPTPRFLEAMIAELKALGVGKDRLHYESYG
jgi:3-ketosteroid 9alpha-monooxygenase subunit B